MRERGETFNLDADGDVNMGTDGDFNMGADVDCGWDVDSQIKSNAAAIEASSASDPLPHHSAGPADTDNDTHAAINCNHKQVIGGNKSIMQL